jgi:hypothetical protein
MAATGILSGLDELHEPLYVREVLQEKKTRKKLGKLLFAFFRFK